VIAVSSLEPNPSSSWSLPDASTQPRSVQCPRHDARCKRRRTSNSYKQPASSNLQRTIVEARSAVAATIDAKADKPRHKDHHAADDDTFDVTGGTARAYMTAPDHN